MSLNENTTVLEQAVPTNSPPEKDDGNIEYKQQLTSLSVERTLHLITQMRYRLQEGGGEALYELGLGDDGTPVGLDADKLRESIENVKQMAKALHSEATVVNLRPGQQGSIAEVLVRHFPLIGAMNASQEDACVPEVRIACVGNVDAGKSTLLGVLTKGELDSGRGTARTAIAVHAHELLTGRTSYIACAVLGYDTHGHVVNYESGKICYELADVVKKSSKILSFFDLAGHEKYLRTTIAGLTRSSVDYTLLVVGGNHGVTHMTKEHYYLSLAMRLPSIVVVTKSDMCPKNVLKESFVSIKTMLKNGPVHRNPLLITTEEQALTYARSLSLPSNKVVPVFLVSSVTGDGLQLLKDFLNLLPCPNWTSRVSERVEMHIDETFNPPGVGVVVSGCLVSGHVEVNQNLLLGPDQQGNFSPVQVRSIQYKRVPVRSVCAGQACTLALKKIKRSAVRRGMVLIGEDAACASQSKPEGCVEFVAEVVILHHSTTIHCGYQSVLHSNSIAQATSVVDIKVLESEETVDEADPVLRSNDKALVKFRFLHRPEWVTKNQLFVFREGTTRGVGRVKEIVGLADSNWSPQSAYVASKKKPRVS